MFSRLEYLDFWRKAVINPTRLSEVHAECSRIVGFKSLYDPVEAATGVPWYVIGVTDYREESFKHGGYLGNGDPLSKKTINVPAGRGPFKNWFDGAIDAIHYRGWDRLPSGGHWDIVTSLIKTEAYNGAGYAHMGMRSPYVWGGTNMQQRGKFTGDHHFDPNAWDVQLGTASLFLGLKLFHGVDLREA